MVDIEVFRNAVKYIIASIYVRPSEKKAYFCPVNLLFIAPAECGKTRFLKGFFAKKVMEVMDLSPKLIKDTLIPKLLSKEIGVLVIPDLIQLVGHKKTTSDSTITFLNALIEEGVKDSLFYGLDFHLPEKVNCSLVTGITPNEFYGHLIKWDSIGFLHRFLPISYDYSEEMIDKVHLEISSGEMFSEVEKLGINVKNPIKIKISKQYSEDIQRIVRRLVRKLGQFTVKKYKARTGKYEDKKFDIKGFRLHDRFRQLARAICFVDSRGRRKEVNGEDVNKLSQFEDIINLPNTTKKI